MSHESATQDYVNQVASERLMPHFIGVSRSHIMKCNRASDINRESRLICLNILDMLREVCLVHNYKMELYKPKVIEWACMGEAEGKDSEVQLFNTKKAAFTLLLQEILPSAIFLEIHDRIMSPNEDNSAQVTSERFSFWDEAFDMLAQITQDERQHEVSISPQLSLRKRDYTLLMGCIEQAADDLRSELERGYNIEKLLCIKATRVPETPQYKVNRRLQLSNEVLHSQEARIEEEDDGMEVELEVEQEVEPEQSDRLADYGIKKTKVDLSPHVPVTVASSDDIIVQATHTKGSASSAMIATFSCNKLPSVEEIMDTYRGLTNLKNLDYMVKFAQMDCQTEGVVDCLLPAFVDIERLNDPSISLIHESSQGLVRHVKTGPRDLGSIILNTRTYALEADEGFEVNDGVQDPKFLEQLGMKYFSKIIVPFQKNNHFICLVFIKNDKKERVAYDCWIINSITQAESEVKDIRSILRTIPMVEGLTIQNLRSNSKRVKSMFGFSVVAQEGCTCPYFTTLNCLSFAMPKPVQVNNDHAVNLCRTMVVYMYTKTERDIKQKLAEMCIKPEQLPTAINNFMKVGERKCLTDLWNFVKHRCQVAPISKDTPDDVRALYFKHTPEKKRKGTEQILTGEEQCGYVLLPNFYQVLFNFVIARQQILNDIKANPKANPQHVKQRRIVEAFNEACRPYIVPDFETTKELIAILREASELFLAAFNQQNIGDAIPSMHKLWELEGKTQGHAILKDGSIAHKGKGSNKKMRK